MSSAEVLIGALRVNFLLTKDIFSFEQLGSDMLSALLSVLFSCFLEKIRLDEKSSLIFFKS